MTKAAQVSDCVISVRFVHNTAIGLRVSVSFCRTQELVSSLEHL